MDLAEIKLSKFSNTYSKTAVTTTLHAELMAIKNGHYRIDIEKCRAFLKENNLESYKLLKAKLPVVTFSGVFHNGHKKENITEYSGHIIIDIDNISSEHILDVKQILSLDRFTLACWVSPSGLGLKVLFKIDTELFFHTHAFKQISEYIKTKYNIYVDKSGSDYSRLCYVSYDAEIFINADAEIYSVNCSTIEGLNVAKESLGSRPSIRKTVTENEKQLFNSTEGRNKRVDRDNIWKLIQFLKKRNKSITRNYDSWFKVALAIANSFTYDVGLTYFHLLSKQDPSYNEVECTAMLEYCYRNRRKDEIGLGTIFHLATEQGFNIPKLNTVPANQ